jgi:hypothetical protein
MVHRSELQKLFLYESFAFTEWSHSYDEHQAFLLDAFRVNFLYCKLFFTVLHLQNGSHCYDEHQAFLLDAFRGQFKCAVFYSFALTWWIHSYDQHQVFL